MPLLLPHPSHSHVGEKLPFTTTSAPALFRRRTFIPDLPIELSRTHGAATWSCENYETAHTAAASTATATEASVKSTARWKARIFETAIFASATR
jgi:hypothetical protein